MTHQLTCEIEQVTFVKKVAIYNNLTSIDKKEICGVKSNGLHLTTNLKVKKCENLK